MYHAVPPVPLLPQVIHLERLPPRIQAMVHAVLQHQTVLCTYDSGSLILHFKGGEVRPLLEKVALQSHMMHPRD